MNTSHTLYLEPKYYRFEWKPGDYVYFTPDEYKVAVSKESARIQALYLEPIYGCLAEVEGYLAPEGMTPRFTAARYVYKKDISQHTPLYLGPVLHEPK